MLWVATITLTVTSVLLLELKTYLETLARKIETTDILNFAKFLLLSGVILPLLPDTPFSEYQINPFKIWLVVVAVSAVSYGNYVLQRLTKGQGITVRALFRRRLFANSNHSGFGPTGETRRARIIYFQAVS